MLEGPLSTPNGDPVLDLTSLAGTFDFTFERPGRDPDNPSRSPPTCRPRCKSSWAYGWNRGAHRSRCW